MTSTHYAQPPAGHTEQPERPRYRMTAAQRNTADDRAHIVRVIAAHPAYTAWLQDKVAQLLEREATRLAEQEAQHHAAARLRDRATGYRRGELGVW